MEKNTTKFLAEIKRRGLTINAVAVGAGIPAPYLYQWAYSKSRPTITDKFIAVCDWLFVNHGYKVDVHDFETEA